MNNSSDGIQGTIEGSLDVLNVDCGLELKTG